MASRRCFPNRACARCPDDPAAELGGEVDAPPQYWRSQPSTQKQLFGKTTFGVPATGQMVLGDLSNFLRHPTGNDMAAMELISLNAEFEESSSRWFRFVDSGLLTNERLFKRELFSRDHPDNAERNGSSSSVSTGPH